MFCFNSELNKEPAGGRWSAAQGAHSMPPKQGFKMRGRAGAGAGGEIAAILGRVRDLQAHSLGSNTPSHFRPGPRQSRLCAWRLPPHTPGRWHEYQPNIVDEETGSHGVCDLQHHGTEPSSNPPCQSPELYVGRARGTLGKRQVRQGQPAWEVGEVQNRPHCPFCGKDEM